MAKITMNWNPHREHYESVNGLVMQREYGTTPNGNPFDGKWVLRDADGRLIGFSKYRNDLAEWNDLILTGDR